MANLNDLVKKDYEDVKKNFDMRFYGDSKTNWRTAFFNNFFGNLPGGYRRDWPGVMLDSKIEDEKASEKLRNMTYREFYKDIDDVISGLGVDMVEVTSLLNQKKIDKAIDIILPVYIKLREKGYSAYPDLIG